MVTDAAWGNAKDCVRIEDNESDWWEETEDAWIRHHTAPRRTAFHPRSRLPDGPDLHQITGQRVTTMFLPPDQTPDKDEIVDVWFQGIRVLKDHPWTGCTVFAKAAEPASQVPASKIHSSFDPTTEILDAKPDRSFYIMIWTWPRASLPAQTTVASWKSFKLKRKVVDTLAAEGQALQSGIGAVHWHRLLFL